jgi:hypothetical protein
LERPSEVVKALNGDKTLGLDGLILVFSKLARRQVLKANNMNECFP